MIRRPEPHRVFNIRVIRVLVAVVILLLAGLSAASTSTFVYDVRAFGAKGDGKTLDTRAINKAIEAAAAAGGGTVNFPAGTYLSVSIRLRSNITLQLDQGATILAANPVPGKSHTIFLSRMSGTCIRTSVTVIGRTA